MNLYKPEGSLIEKSENYEAVSTLAGLKRAFEKQTILESHATLCDRDFNLHIALGPHLHGIMAREEVQYPGEDEEIKDIAILTRVGKPVCFKVIGFEAGEGGDTIVHLSRRAAQKECLLSFIAGLIPGDIIDGRVTHLEPFGAFIDVACGIISLLSIDSISVSRIGHPSARLHVGQSLRCVIRSIDERGRIFVSRRELLGTWEENAARFSEGQTVRGIVRSVEDYGVFIELAPNLAGLAEYRADARPGQTAAVYVKSIIPDKMKVKLIIIDLTDDAPPPTFDEDFPSVAGRDHLDAWVYSPERSKRIIRTDFR